MAALRLNVEIGDHEYIALKDECKRRGVSISDVMRDLVVRWLGGEYFKRNGVLVEVEGEVKHDS